jgi:hypothetical protein
LTAEIYYFCISKRFRPIRSADPRRALRSCRGTARHRRCTGNTANSPSRAECKQSVELGRVIPNAVGARDEDLPTLVSQSPSLGDSDRDAQPNRRRDIFTSRRMHHEGHGNTLFVQRPILWSIAISIPAAEHEARSTVRNELPNRRPWIIHSGNLPGPAFQPRRPLDMTGSRLPTISRPSAFSCDVFPSTRCSDRPWFGKWQRRMICVMKDVA